MPRLSLRLELLLQQLLLVNDRTTASPTLERIIRETVPEQGLLAFGIRGLRGDEIHIALEVEISYTINGLEFEVRQINPGRWSTGGDAVDRFSTTGEKKDLCRSWNRACDTFMQAVQAHGLITNTWFRFDPDRCSEYIARYSLGYGRYTDKTIASEAFSAENSVVPDQWLHLRCSDELR